MPSPYKDKDELITEINKFVNSHNAYLGSHSKRISNYFEMICYNNTIKFYKKNQYSIEIENLDRDNNFVYKLNPTGIPSNFSSFKVEKKYSKKTVSFEVHHNLSVESCWEKDTYFTPDVSVVNSESIQYKKGFYKNKNRFSYCKNVNLQTFIEAKHIHPFPGILFSFSGLVLEMMSEIIQNKPSENIPKHISPSLVLSGNGNLHSKRIQESLMKRYNVNVIFGLFYKSSRMHSKEVRKIGTRDFT